jgi:hypothetical protein
MADAEKATAARRSRSARAITGRSILSRRFTLGARMTTLQVTLPDTLAKQAQQAGLLTPEALERLLQEALRRRDAADRLLAIAERTANESIAPMTMEEINAEVKAYRDERRRRETGR